MKQTLLVILQILATSEAATTTSCHFDCQVGLNNWKAGWGEEKIIWCCKHEGLACPEGEDSPSDMAPHLPEGEPPDTTTTTTSCHFDCQAGLNNWKMAWAEPKKEWCCKHEGIACPETTTVSTSTTSCHFDCQAGLNNWKMAWAEPKKEWCCKHEKIACPETTTEEPTTTSCHFDCQAGLNNWKMAWAEPKKEWCCKHEGIACPETTTVTITATTSTTLAPTLPPTVPPTLPPTLPPALPPLRLPSTLPPPELPTIPPLTTTSCHFDCQAGLNNWEAAWAQPKKEWCCEHEKIACPTTAPVPKVMTCSLACFGAGGRPITLPGSVGVGAGASLNDVSLDDCRRACATKEGCEAVMFTNKTKGVPFKTMCYGKQDLHTSKCQPGGDYITEIMMDAKKVWGKCAIFGDPHVITFDRVYGPPNTITDPGEFFLLKSDDVNIHGRFGYTHRFPTASSAVGIAIGGPMIKNHKLVVAYAGPERGYKGFQVMWDGARILQEYPSKFTSPDGVLKADHDAMDPQKYHREGRHTIGGTKGLLPSYHFLLEPDISIYMLIGPDNCNIVIEMPRVTKPQDGWCGNFNCNQDDDAISELEKRGMAAPIPLGQSLFIGGPVAPAWTMQKVAAPTLDDCSPDRRAQAEKECSGLTHGERGACIFDICATNKAGAKEADVGIEALPFNCNEGSPAAWEAKQQKWCCEKEKICPGAGEVHMANPCDSDCDFSGQSATCKERVYWASTHQFMGHDDACTQSINLVKSQCGASCAQCELGMTDCSENGEPKMHFFRKFEESSIVADQTPSTQATSGLSWQVACLGAGAVLLAVGLFAGRFNRRGGYEAQPLSSQSPDAALE